MRRVLALSMVLAVTLVSRTVQADTIDFEVGFTDQQSVSTVTTSTNSVVFSVGASAGAGNAFIARVGGPETAFAPSDTPASTAISGNFFLTDEFDGPSARLDYFMDFAKAVSSLELDLFDFRVDGGPTIGDTATLIAYADAARTIVVGSSVFTIPSPNPADGNIVHLAILAPSSPILAASLVFSTGDVGTGIDNIQFATVPEPGALGLLAAGLLASGLALRGRSARRRRHEGDV